MQHLRSPMTKKKNCGSIKVIVCTREYANFLTEMLVCMLIYLKCKQMCFSSQPQHPGIKQKEGWEVRSGAVATPPSPQHSVRLWAKANKQSWPAAGCAQQGGIARSGYRREEDRKDGRRLIDAAHYFQPRKTGTNTKETMATGVRGQENAFIETCLLNEPHKNM